MWEKRWTQGVQPPHISTRVAGDVCARRRPLPFSTRLTRSDFDPQAAGGAGDGAAEQRLDAEGAGAVGESAGRRSARMSTMAAGLTPASARSKAASQALSCGGDDGRAVADLDAVAVEVGLRGARQHDARAVVAVEDQRLLERALGEHDLARRAPSTSARAGRRRAATARWSVRRWQRPTRFWW